MGAFSSQIDPDFTSIDEIAAGLRRGAFPFGGRIDPADRWALHQAQPSKVDIYEVTNIGQARSYIRYWVDGDGTAADTLADCVVEPPPCDLSNINDVDYDPGFEQDPRAALARLDPPPFDSVPPEQLLVLPWQETDRGKRELQIYALDESGTATAVAIGKVGVREPGGFEYGWAFDGYGPCGEASSG